ncbi:hypothetical protein FN846DRAFT_904367 [Sphaerosporella brunnea]|uniref:Uncharacterized protein n=1 Tax=Sphaerosporella brunnea TaxID=1250544 RepID=A0A5J5F521_9PEZI|nr:hypothetical protein FN846DRAFT_904367 [Sphaerosporella brunnea]
MAYLLSPQGRSECEVVALCTSTLASARAAVEAHNHQTSLARQARAGGGGALGADPQEADELARIAEEKAARTVVGLQARVDPLIATVRVLSRAAGSGSCSAQLSLQLPAFWAERYAYTAASRSGGTLLSLGEIAQFQSLLANQRKTVDLVNDKQEVVPADTADHIFLHGFRHQQSPRENVERLYEAFAVGDQRLASVADVVERHRFFEGLYAGKLGQPVIFASRT